jgi:hypothetical protein
MILGRDVTVARLEQEIPELRQIGPVALRGMLREPLLELEIVQ